MTAKATPTVPCAYCGTLAPRLYVLPPRAIIDRHGGGPACHFCFLRRAGIKPNRRHLAPAVDAATPAVPVTPE